MNPHSHPAAASPALGASSGQRAATQRPVIQATPGLVTAAERAFILRQYPATLWFTGFSGAGKTTIAHLFERRLADRKSACFVLDGDAVRGGLCKNLGFSRDDRSENIRRIAEVARLLNDAGLLVICSLISPMRSDRENARTIIGNERFLEVFVEASLRTCEARDPRGLYARARAGEIKEFTGISAPYEQPEGPDIRLRTEEITPAQAVEMMASELVSRGYLKPADGF